MRPSHLALAALLLAFFLSGCGKPADKGGEAGKIDTAGADYTNLSGLIEVDGSSTVFPVTEAVAEEFQKATKGKVKLTVGISGTGGGFKKFVRGETAVQNASRPILESEMKQAREAKIDYIELPICFDALTVAVNNENTWVDHITVDELKKAWEPGAQGKVTKWSQLRDGWPDEEFKLYGPGADSGTFDYFTEAICGKSKASRGDYGASEDDNTIVQGVEGSKHGWGYLPYAYYAPHAKRMKAVPIKWSKNKVPEAVLPNEENVLKGIYNPLSRPLFIYVNKKHAERPEVAALVEFYLNNVKTLSKEVKYMPLPDAAYKMGLERFKARQTGTGFGGHPEVGLPVEEILKRKPTS